MRLHKYGVIALLIVSLAFLLAILVWRMGSSSSPLKDMERRLSKGMTAEQLRLLAGEPNNIAIERQYGFVTNDLLYHWDYTRVTDGGRFLRVVLDDKGVVHRWFPCDIQRDECTVPARPPEREQE